MEFNISHGVKRYFPASAEIEIVSARGYVVGVIGGGDFTSVPFVLKGYKGTDTLRWIKREEG